MKKFTFAVALLGGIALVGAGSASAADWRGGGYRVEPVRHVAPIRRDYRPTVAHHDDYCDSTPVRRYEPVYNTHRNDHFSWNEYDDSRYGYNDYRYTAPVSRNKGFGLSSPGLNFWYGR